MDASAKKRFAEIIQTQIEKLEQEITDLKARNKPVPPDKAIGRLSRLEAMNDKSVLEANLRKSELRLTKLKQAAQTVEDDDFGLCTVCEEPISEKRLAILPESNICMACLKERG